MRKQRLCGIKWLAHRTWLTSHEKPYVVFFTHLGEILGNCMSQTCYWPNIYIMSVQKFAAHFCLILCSSVDKMLEGIEWMGKYYQLLNPTDPFFSPWRKHKCLLLLLRARVARTPSRSGDCSYSEVKNLKFLFLLCCFYVFKVIYKKHALIL